VEQVESESKRKDPSKQQARIPKRLTVQEEKRIKNVKDSQRGRVLVGHMWALRS
jgi:hypothetical protein